MFKLGIDRIDEYKHLFKGKRVGLITNPTGMNSDFQTTIDIFFNIFNLTALFSPEHGVRGLLQAGVRLDDYVDEKTGVIVYSLYGKNKKPSKKMLNQIDILAIDIQDVGVRFYTYLYTVAYAIEACKEYNKPIVIFDRPNPLGGIKVEGNIIDKDFLSFVGGYNLVQRYGLTIGEFALYVNSEFHLNADLTVIPMSGYSRDMTYQNWKTPWVMPSPNIPREDVPLAYACTCLFEGTNISEGRGTTKPFQVFGSPYLKQDAFLAEINKLPLEGFVLRPMYFTPSFSKYKGEHCKGFEMHITDPNKLEPIKTGMAFVKTMKELHTEFVFIPPFKESLKPMIDLLVGSDFIRLNKMSLSKIFAIIDRDSERFSQIKRRYHIYE